MKYYSNLPNTFLNFLYYFKNLSNFLYIKFIEIFIILIKLLKFPNFSYFRKYIFYSIIVSNIKILIQYLHFLKLKYIFLSKYNKNKPPKLNQINLILIKKSLQKSLQKNYKFHSSIKKTTNLFTNNKLSGVYYADN